MVESHNLIRGVDHSDSSDVVVNTVAFSQSNPAHQRRQTALRIETFRGNAAKGLLHFWLKGSVRMKEMNRVKP